MYNIKVQDITITEGGWSTKSRKIIFYLAMLWLLYNIVKEIYKLRYWK